MLDKWSGSFYLVLKLQGAILLVQWMIFVHFFFLKKKRKKEVNLLFARE